MNKVVSTVSFHDYILIFCEDGDIYKMVLNDLEPWRVTFSLFAQFRPKP